MESPFHLLAIVLFFAMVTADINQDYCFKHMPKTNQTDTTNYSPTFYDNFYVFIEKKQTIQKTVVYQDEYYSLNSRQVYGTYRTINNQTQFWVQGNQIMESSIGGDVCLNKETNGYSTHGLLGVTVDPTGNVTMATPEIALGWHKGKQQASFQGSCPITYTGTCPGRGLHTDVWFVCLYNEITQITTVNEFHFVDPTNDELPQIVDGFPAAVPVMIRVSGVDNSIPNTPTEFTYRLDLTSYGSVSTTDKVFQIQPAKLCSANPTLHIPLPTPPSFFQYSGETMTILLPGNNPSAPDLTYIHEAYIQLSQVFIQDMVRSPKTGEVYMRTVNDYSSGLSFLINMETGRCNVQAISTGGGDAIPVSGGNVVMKNSKQLFDLDSDQYQYMGISKQRGIECDTWSAYFTDNVQYHDQQSLYTWYFATANFKKNFNMAPSVVMPVALEITQPLAYILNSYYNFDTLDVVRVPDLSMCFSSTNTMNVEFYVTASYVKVVAPDVHAFNQAVYTSLWPLTGSSVRVSQLDVQPASSTSIVVRFKMYDLGRRRVNGTRNILTPNVQVYSNLNSQVNAGTFSIVVFSSSNKQTTVYAQANSVGQYEDGKVVFESKSSANFSAGAMGGVAVGMLIVGVIIGAIIIFAVKKVRAGKQTPDFNLKKLEEESAS